MIVLEVVHEVGAVALDLDIPLPDVEVLEVVHEMGAVSLDLLITCHSTKHNLRET